MKLRIDQLKNQLQKTLAPVYLVSGDETLLVQEACDAIRQAARLAGCTERVLMHVEAGFDWAKLLHLAGNRNLFADRQLLELRLPSAKPGDEGSKALQHYCQQAAPDNVLLIVCPKLDAAPGKWVNAIDQIGVVVQIWPLELNQFPKWIGQRFQNKGMRPEADVVALLAERVEGNLLAAAQEIDKLYLLYGATSINMETVQNTVADSARFDIYDLADTVLAGQAERVVRILRHLQEEGAEPTLILWSVVRDLRLVAAMAAEQGRSNVESLLSQHRIWDKRKQIFRTALPRYNAQRWRALLKQAADVDLLIKGFRAGSIWDELLELSLTAAGGRVFQPAKAR